MTANGLLQRAISAVIFHMRVLLADAILIVHFLFVLFVIGGLLLTWLGAWRGWRWIRNLKFRIAHLIAIVFVACEALLGIVCPLTQWEDTLRSVPSDKSFIARWIHQLMYFSLPEWVFTAAYVLFAGIAALTWALIPPHKRREHPVRAPR